VKPFKRSVDWLGLNEDSEYRPIERSEPIELGVTVGAERIDWPPAG